MWNEPRPWACNATSGIEETAKKFKLDRSEAGLLHMTDIAAEGGVELREFKDKTQDLMTAVADGSIPAKEGLEALGEQFATLRSEAQEAGRVGDRAMVQMIQRSRELGQDIPGVKDHVREQLNKAMGGVAAMTGTVDDEGKVSGGLAIASQDDANSQAQIFSATFWAKVREDGIIEAATAMQEPFQALQQKMVDAGMNVEAVMGPIRNIMALTANESTAAITQGIGGLSDVLTGLADSGYMTEGAFKGIQQQAGSAFEQLKAEGVDSSVALQAIAPLLGQLKSASEEYGLKLDDNTESLLMQAEAAGIAFPTDPMQQVVDILRSIATVMGAEIPASARSAKDSMSTIGTDGSAALDSIKGSGIDAMQTLADSAGVTSDTIKGAFAEAAGVTSTTMGDAFHVLADGALVASDTVSSALGEMVGVSKFASDEIAGHVQALDGMRAEITVQYNEQGKPGGSPDVPPEYAPPADVSAASGMWSPGLRSDTLIQAHEGEAVAIIPKQKTREMNKGASSSQTMGETVIPITLQIDGRALGTWITRATKTGHVRVHHDAISSHPDASAGR